MRSQKRNQQCLYYATYNNKIPEVDENGDFTGNYITGYSKPVIFYANLSAGKGASSQDAFGKDCDFTRSITTTDMDLQVDEFSLIWFETKPVLLPDGTADPDSADYTVAAPVARSLNSLMIAIKKRKKSGVA